VIVEALIFLHMYRLPFVQITMLGATNSLTHWIGWIGTLYLFFATPLEPIVKRRYPTHLKTALPIHMIGNMLAVMLVSVHFAHQVTRSAANYPDLGTGLALYAAMVTLTATGIVMYSSLARRFSKQARFLHPTFAVVFYTVILVHILHGISII
jgi:hypothetical protein